MRKLFTCMLLAVLGLPVLAQVNKAEYFIDADPGIGQGTNISITAGNDVNTNFNIPLTNTATGLHTISVRTRDIYNRWSLTATQSFYVNEISSKNGVITKAEYFIDDDPGFGNANQVNIAQGSTIYTKFSVPLTRATPGLHTLYIRTRDALGRWSLTASQSFYVNEISTKNGTITKLEYFIDDDPGFGNANQVNIAQGATVDTKFSVPLSKASAGLHTLYIRTRDALGRWSLTASHTFFNNDLFGNNNTLARAEYYIDTDPGRGKGTAVNIRAGQTEASVYFNVDLKNVSNGIHTLYVRTADNRGAWSLSNQQIFYVKNSGIEKITTIKYNFTDGSFTSTVRTYTLPTPATSITADFTADLSGLPADKEYTMQIYAVTESGVQTPVRTKQIKVCSQKLAKADFELVQADYRVNFIAKDTTGKKYTWDFGDGKKDSIRTVLHTYTKVGVYKVKLIVSNFCNADTVEQTINVSGLTGIATNHGGNTGSVTATISGAGFNETTKLFISNGSNKIQGENLIVRNSGAITATFNLKGQPAGRADIIAIFSGNKTDTIPNAFVIENGNVPKLHVSLSGNSVLRVGFSQVYTVTYSNTGNTDATLVPLLISGLPLGTDIELLEPTFPINSVPGFDGTKNLLPTLKRTVNDSTSKSAFRWFYLNTIAANSTNSLHFIFHLPSDAELHTRPKIQVIIGEGLQLNSVPGLVKVNTLATNPKKINDTQEVPETASVAECVGSIFDLVGTAVGGIAKHATPLQEWIQCGVGVAGIVKSGFDEYLTRSKGKITAPLDMGETTLGVFSTFVDCGKAAIGTAFSELKVVIAVTDVLTSGAILLKGANTFKKCTAAFTKSDDDVFVPIVGNAVDPNQLLGPGDASLQHFTNQQGALNYTVNFENKSTSNLNAQTVTVIDTLSGNYYNTASFGFTSITIGDSLYTLPSPVTSFIHDFDFRAKYNIKARIVAKYDTLTGIAQWKFYTIDPITNQITDDALAGFLPPDDALGHGQGYVSYKIEPKSGFSTGDMVNNKAFITFDYNPVIPTNQWSNTFDFVKPVSKVDILPAISADSSFAVTWGGSDNLSGVGRYNIYYSINRGEFQPWLTGVDSTSAVFIGQKDSTYSFYSIAYDNAGNIEPGKSSAEATTTVKISLPQTITFPVFADKVYGEADFMPTANASSGLPVIYTSSDLKVISIVAGKFHIVGAGTAVITASQPGDTSFLAALPVSNSIVVNKATQKIAFPSIPAKGYHEADFAAGGTASSGLEVSYLNGDPGVLTVVNGKIHFIKAGTSTVSAYQAGNNNYLPSDTVSQVITAVFTLAANNFKISATSESCRNSNNGEINIIAAATQNYAATISKAGVSSTYAFTQSASVKNLSVGLYNVCITIADQPGFKQCFDVTIAEPEDLSVYSNVDAPNGMINLHFTGGAAYHITLNGEVYNTDKSDISLPVANGKNTLSVVTDNICQGKYEKIFSVPAGITAYPNPFKDIVSVSVTNDNSTTAAVEVVNNFGRTVYKANVNIGGGKCVVNLSELGPGVYILHLKLDHQDKRIKIFKQ